MEETLHPDVRSVICTPYNTLGRFCPGCDLKHLPLFRLGNELRAKQLEYVRQNSDKLCLNAKSSHWVKGEDKHLLGNANGPLRAGETRG